MYNNKKEIEKIVDDFCMERNQDRNIFEVSNIAFRAKGGKNGKLQNTTPVNNKNCTYIIKYYKMLDLFVIWNYKANQCEYGMSYSLDTIREKLRKGINKIDKGKNYHNKEQYYIYCGYGNELYNLLTMICNVG